MLIYCVVAVPDNYHTYRDATGFIYNITVSRVDLSTNKNERYNIKVGHNFTRLLPDNNHLNRFLNRMLYRDCFHAVSSILGWDRCNYIRLSGTSARSGPAATLSY